MDKLSDCLIKYGCDINKFLNSRVNDLDFYLECLEEFINDPDFDTLLKEVKSKNINIAFRTAHTLKGVIANLEIEKMYKLDYEIVETLRLGKLDNVLEKVEKLIEMKEEIKSIFNQNNNEKNN